MKFSGKKGWKRMLDLDNNLQWDFTIPADSAQKQSSAKNPPNLEAYLDFLDDIDAFQSVTIRRESFFYKDEFEL
jgi:hypothetical protein